MSLGTRPVLREPLPVRPWAAVTGAIAAGLWMISFGLFGMTLRGHVAWSLVAGAVAWAVAAVLAGYGDRGVAVGVAAAAGAAWAATVLTVIVEWIRLGDWPL